MGAARIRVEGWGWRHAGRRAWAVRDLDLSIEAGQRVLLLGASGAGKSTLLHALAGVLGGADEGEQAGRIRIGDAAPQAQRGRVGLVMQDPQSQVVLARVGDDVAFGLENLQLPADQIWPRVREALDLVGLQLPLDHNTEQLSGGQQQRLVLAGALAMRPEVLVLDEPTANLDPAGVVQLRDAVAAVVADRNITLVVVEHRIDTWLPLVDRVVVLAAGGGLVADGPPEEVFARHGAELARIGAWVPRQPPGIEPREQIPTGSWDLAGRGLGIGYQAGCPVRTGIEVELPRGVSTVVTGQNGSGKTTLALTLAGLLPALEGRVEASPGLAPPGRPDPGRWRSAELLTRIGTVFQEPEHQFVTASVHDELGIGLRALRRPAGEIRRRVDELLELLRLGSLARANPFTLSGGEKRRLSVGTVLATRPQVIVLDEPTFGQDRITWMSLVRLVREQLEQGTTVISVTHDQTYLEVLGEHQIQLGEP